MSHIFLLSILHSAPPTSSVGQYLVSGDYSGDINIWDTRQNPNEEGLLNTSLTFQAHKDCVNGIRYRPYFCNNLKSDLLCSLHPTLSLLASSSGQRKFPLKNFLDCSDDEDSDYSEDMQENCLKLWSLSTQQCSTSLNSELICT